MQHRLSAAHMIIHMRKFVIIWYHHHHHVESEQNLSQICQKVIKGTVHSKREVRLMFSGCFKCSCNSCVVLWTMTLHLTLYQHAGRRWEILSKDAPSMCRTCLRNIMFLSSLKNHGDPVMVVCKSTGSPQTGSDDSSFGNVLIKVWSILWLFFPF